MVRPEADWEYGYDTYGCMVVACADTQTALDTHPSGIGWHERKIRLTHNDWPVKQNMLEVNEVGVFTDDVSARREMQKRVGSLHCHKAYVIVAEYHAE